MCWGVLSGGRQSLGVRGLFMRPTQAIEKVGEAPVVPITTPTAPQPSGRACSSTLLGHHCHRCGGCPPKHSRTSGGQLSEGSGVPAPPVTQHTSQRQ